MTTKITTGAKVTGPDDRRAAVKIMRPQSAESVKRAMQSGLFASVQEAVNFLQRFESAMMAKGKK